MVGRQPVAKFKHGCAEAAIFENEISKGEKTFRLKKIVFQKNYLDRDDKWQTTSSLDVNDVPKAILVLSKAYEFVTRAKGTKESEEEELM